jgi:hypothetical protein
VKNNLAFLGTILALWMQSHRVYQVGLRKRSRKNNYLMKNLSPH